MSEINACMIVVAQSVQTARSVATAILGTAGAGMWPTGLSANGQEPATHYVSAGFVDEALVNALRDPAIANSETGIGLAECEQLTADMDVSEGSPHAALARLGLQLVSVGDDEEE